MTSSYEPRRVANDKSLAGAVHHREIWECYELELLEEGWSEATLPEIAELLGRTIEACRQKYTEILNRPIHAQRTKQAKSSSNAKWDRGWTSLEDMGY